jgi:excisionase family DNA binding protein
VGGEVRSTWAVNSDALADLARMGPNRTSDPLRDGGDPGACTGGLSRGSENAAYPVTPVGSPACAYANETGLDRLLSATELAHLLGLTPRWVYAQVEEHGLPAYKVGRTLLFEALAVRRWLETRRIGDWPESCGESAE